MKALVLRTTVINYFAQILRMFEDVELKVLMTGLQKSQLIQLTG